MYIYFPRADAYLCIHRTTKFVFIKNRNRIVHCSQIGWENWNKDEDEYGNRRLYYTFPDGEKLYPCLPHKFFDGFGYNTCLCSTDTPTQNAQCFFAEKKLVFSYDRSRFDAVPFPGRTLLYLRSSQDDAERDGSLEYARVEMFPVLPAI